MTLDTDISKIQYLGNGEAREFPLPYKVLEAGHLRLITYAAGQESEFDGGYQVRGLGGDQASVLLDQALAAGVKLTIKREVPLVQPTDLQNGGDFNADVLEAAFDYLEMQIQQNAEGIDRAIKLAVSNGENSDQYAREIFQAHGEAVEAASRAETAADLAEHSSLHAAAAAAQSREDANRAAALVDSASLSSGLFNLRKALLLENTLHAGSVLTLPGYYYPTRDILYLSFDGAVCTPRKGGAEAFGEYQYSEIGDNPNQQSNQVLLHFTAQAGSVFDMWVVSPAAAANIDKTSAVARLDKLLEADLAAGTPLTVPPYIVNSGTLQIFIDGVLCAGGAGGSYKESGNSGARSEVVTFNTGLAAGSEITAVVAM